MRFLLVLGLAATAASTADFSIKWVGLAGTQKPVVGQAFSLGASLVNTGPDRANARVNVEVPAGVSRIGGTFECTQEAAVLHCDEASFPVGDNGTGTVSFSAGAPGSYTFKVYLDHLDAADPNVADNSDSITVTVGAKPVTAGALATAPAHPRAGTSFVVSLGVTGATVSSARCTTSIGTAKARRSGTRASCTVRTPASARGRVLRGSLVVTAGTHTFSRRFSLLLR